MNKQNKLLALIIAVAVIIVVLLIISKSATTNTHNPTDANITKINDPGYAQAVNQLDNLDVNADLNNSTIVNVGQ